MRQLLQNLIANALKFRAGGRSPVIRIHSHPLDADASRAVVVVEDNGIGFDNIYAERIFAPFQRLHGRAVDSSDDQGASSQPIKVVIEVVRG
jgi:light-regulated signal transduction histidine kinase (bacteriophytochrome)